jgi:hypothetical protein
MRYRKADFHLPFASSVLRPRVIDFVTATAMFQALAAALALLKPVSVTCPLTSFDYYLFPVLRIAA